MLPELLQRPLLVLAEKGGLGVFTYCPLVGKHSWVWLLLNLTVGQGGALRTDRIPLLVAGLTPQSGTLGCLLRFLLRKHGACRNMASCRGVRHKHAVFPAPSPGSSFSGLPAQDLAWDPSSGIPPPCVRNTVP